jgi:uncharacterized protein with PIN domain
MSLNIKSAEAHQLAHELTELTGTGEPLLFKGKDFSHTDVVPAAP